MSAGSCRSLCVPPSTNWRLVQSQLCLRPRTAGILVSTPLHECTHTVQTPVLSEIRRLLATSSSLSLNTYSHNAYTNTPARMAHLTPEISKPREVPDGGCRLGACSLTGLVLLDPRVSRSIREMEEGAGKSGVLDTGWDTAGPLHCGFPLPEICRRDAIGVGFQPSWFVLGSYRARWQASGARAQALSVRSRG